jgi:hypothetical protein
MSFEYSGRQIPDDDDGLVDLIRREARRDVVEDRRDGRPESQLDWMSGMLTVHSDVVPRVEAAYARLVSEADPDIVRAILDQADHHPSRNGFVKLLVDAIGQSASVLKRKSDPLRTDGTTLLGATVRELNRRTNHRAPLSPAAVTELARVDRYEDGWPESELMLLAFDFDVFSSRLIPTVAQLLSDDEKLGLFVAAMANVGAPLTTKGFELLGRAGGELRDKFAARLRTFLSEAEHGRQQLIASEHFKTYSREIQRRLTAGRDDPWPEYASRLGVESR